MKKRDNYKSFYNLVLKPFFDFVIALILIIICLPLILLISFIIILTSGFPVFYRAPRGGYKNKSFKIFKFRTMVKNADKIGGGTTALNDPRITKVGAFLRKTKLDEIPQLFNILFGQMSFIGPRPELIKYTSMYEGEEEKILKVKPGITDFSSIEFINLDEVVGAVDADKYYEENVLKKKNALRIKYAENVSLFVDIKLFFLTVFRVFKKAFKHIFRSKRKKD